MESSTQIQEKDKKNKQEVQKEVKPAIAPGQMRVIKRNGSVVSYDAEKIAIAITKAFLAVEGGAAAELNRIHHEVNELAKAVTIIFHRTMAPGGTFHLEQILYPVQLELMLPG